MADRTQAAGDRSGLRPPSTTGPRFQIALDVTSVDDAVKLARQALDAGADQLEIGKPLVEFVGLTGVAPILANFPDVWFEVDLMIIAGADRYVGAAADLGAQGVTVSGLAPSVTISDAIEAGRARGVRVCVDLFNVIDPVEAALQVGEMGAGAVMVHVGADQRRHDPTFNQLGELEEIAGMIAAPVAYATYDSSEAIAAVGAGASEIVQGAPLIAADDPEKALRAFINDVRKAVEAKP